MVTEFDVFAERADPEERQKEIAGRNKRQRDRELGDIRKVLSTPEGRRFVWRIMSTCGIFRSSMTGTSQTFFNEGQREIGLFLLNETGLARPDAFVVMQADAKFAALNDSKGLE